MSFKAWENMGENVPSTSTFSERIFDHLQPGNRVLDVGCGYGRISRTFRERGFRLVGIDINKDAIAAAKFIPGVEFYVQSADNLEFEDNFFDGAFTQASLGSMEYQVRVKSLTEICRVLRKGGVLQVAEFGLGNNPKRYEEDEKITGEYGTIITKYNDVEYRSHNFEKEELADILKGSGFNILNYEVKPFMSVNSNPYPGHIFIAKKI